MLLTDKDDETWVTNDSILDERSVELFMSLNRNKNREIQSFCRDTVRKGRKLCNSWRKRESWHVCNTK